MKRIKHILFIIVFTFLCSIPASAYSSNAVTVNLKAQEQTNYCWAACVQSCIRYYYPLNNASQTDINYYINGNNDNGATPLQMTDALDHYNISSTAVVSPVYGNVVDLLYDTVVDEIDASRPIIAHTTAIGVVNSAHAVLIMGYYSASSGGKVIGFKNPLSDQIYSNTVYASMTMAQSGGIFMYVDSNGVQRRSSAHVYQITPDN